MLVLAEPISSPLTIPSRHGKYFEGIRLDAGADLLNYYQFQWCRMREASDKNYHLAEVQLNDIYKYYKLSNNYMFYENTSK